MKKLILTLSLMLLLTSCSYFSDSKVNDATVSAFQSAVDTSFAKAIHKSGISVAVYTDRDIWTYATGKAWEGTAMTTSTPAYAYSITKTFISALVLTQIEKNLYTLDHTVAALLAGNADYNSLSAPQKGLINTAATVRQLLTHTSGMPDYASNVSGILDMCTTDPSYTWKPVDIIENILSESFGASGSFEYSNTNYVLLGMIAEHLGGKTLNTLLADTFFNDLGISAVLAPQDAIPSNIAHPYDDTYLFTAPSPGLGFMDLTIALSLDPATSTYDFYLGAGRSTWAAGGIIATAENIARWGFELYNPDGYAVTSSVRASLKASAAADGNYGFGVSYYDFVYADGTAGGTYGHDGSAPGYKTLLRYESSQGISVAIITNLNNLPDTTASSTDTELGIVDREALAEDLFNAYKNNN